MFSFTKEQKTYDLKGKKVGGAPGENPTLMVGTLFYEGQFKEPKASLKRAKELILEQERISKNTHVPTVPDLFIFDEDEVEWKIDFAVENIDGFFSLDMPESEVRIQALEYLQEKNALDRVIYNSINLGISEGEIEALEEHTPKAAVILAYNPQDRSTQGRVDIIRNGGKLLDDGLLTTAQNIGIDHPLLDTAAQSFNEGASETLRSVPVFKSEFGLPVGCAMHNTVEAWLWLKEHENKNKIFDVLDTSINDLPVLLGADFVYYGPIEKADIQLPNMAMVDKLVAEGAEEYFGVDIQEDHPFHTL